MKFRMLVPCPNCGKRLTVETRGDDRYPDPHCECGAAIWLVQSDMRVSRRALARAEAELHDEDYSLAIILAAMAVECELAFLFSKWKMLDADLLPSEVTPAHSEAWETEFRKVLHGVGGKLDAVTRFLTNSTFDDFIARNKKLSALLPQVYPNMRSRKPKTFFVQELFRRRNKILHSGQVQFTKEDAEACTKMAMSLLQILAEIDNERYRHFEEELKAKT